MCLLDTEVILAPVYLLMELINLQLSIELKHFFEREKLSFMENVSMKTKFPFLKQLAMCIRAEMVTVYFCKSLFFKLKIVKSKNPTNLSDENMNDQTTLMQHQ